MSSRPSAGPWPRVSRRGVVIASTCAVVACGRAPAIVEEGAPPVAVDTATLSAAAVRIAAFTYDTVRYRPWRITTPVPARIMLDPARVQAIGSLTEGRIKQVNVRVGDRVSAGQVLVLIHSHEIMAARGALAAAQSQLVAAENELGLARASSERAGRLLEARAISRAEVDRLQAAMSTAGAAQSRAAAEVARAEALVEHLVGRGPTPAAADPHDVLVRTPIAGVVIGRDAQPGQVVLPGTPLVSVGDPRALLLQMRVPERAANSLRAGALVRFTVAGFGDDSMHASVVRIAPTVDTLTRTVEVLAKPTDGAAGVLAESFAQAEIASESGGSEVLVVPAAALQVLEGDTIVILVEQRGEGALIRAVAVRTGRRSGASIEVLSGVTAGDRVIVGGAAIAKAELLKRRGIGADD